jgi:hypothetical protein
MIFMLKGAKPDKYRDRSTVDLNRTVTTTIADAGVSGWIATHSARAAPVFRGWRRKVSGCFAASSGNICASRLAAVR